MKNELAFFSSRSHSKEKSRKIGNIKQNINILLYCWWECKPVQLVCRTFWQHLLELLMIPPFG